MESKWIIQRQLWLYCKKKSKRDQGLVVIATLLACFGLIHTNHFTGYQTTSEDFNYSSLEASRNVTTSTTLAGSFSLSNTPDSSEMARQVNPLIENDNVILPSRKHEKRPQSLRMSSTECWVEWDKLKKDSLMDIWLAQEVPVLVTAVAETNNNNQHSFRRKVYTILTQSHMSKRPPYTDFNNVEWVCLYQQKNNIENDNNDSAYHNDDEDETFLLHQQSASFAPRHPKKGRDNVVLICNYTATATTTMEVDSTDRPLVGVKPLLTDKVNATVSIKILNYYNTVMKKIMTTT
jgi:hypothetical protein